MVSARKRPQQESDAQLGRAARIEPEALAQMVEMIMTQGYTFGHALGTSGKQLKALYAWGYELQKRGQFEQAMLVFQYLCYLNHYDEHAWIALGFCREQLKLPQQALAAYVMAGTLDPDNPIPALRSAECLLQMGELAAAKSAAEMTLELAGDDPRLQQRRARAEVLLNVIRKKQRNRKPQP